MDSNEITPKQKKDFETLSEKVFSNYYNVLSSLGYKEDQETSNLRVIGFQTKRHTFLQLGNVLYSRRNTSDKGSKEILGMVLGFFDENSKDYLHLRQEVRESDNDEKWRTVSERLDTLSPTAKEGSRIILAKNFVHPTRLVFGALSTIEKVVDCYETLEIGKDPMPNTFNYQRPNFRETAEDLITKIQSDKIGDPLERDLGGFAGRYIQEHGLPENEQLKDLQVYISGKVPDGKMTLDSFPERVKRILATNVEGPLNKQDTQYLQTVVIEGIERDLKIGYLKYVVDFKWSEGAQVKTDLEEFTKKLRENYEVKPFLK
jgi:hypothetical protein